MRLMKVSRFSIILMLLTSSAVCRSYARPQSDERGVISFSTFMQMCSGQPDSIVDWLVSINQPSLSFKFTNRMRLARKQGMYRREFYPLENETRLKNRADKDYKLILISRPGQPSIALDPQQATYAETPEEPNTTAVDINSIIRGNAKELARFRIENLGGVSIDGHQATKIRMTVEGEAGEMFFYFAKDLKNLLIRIESDKSVGASLIVSNTSFDVPDGLFEIPRGYRKVDFDSFNSTLKQKTKASRPNKDENIPAGAPGMEIKPPSRPIPSVSVEAAEASDVDTQPVLLSEPKPNYTEAARKNMIEGVVIVGLLIGADGTVKQVKVIAGLPDGLNEEAIKAAYKRTYKPAMKNGQPVKTWIRAEIEFQLGRK